MSMQFLLMKIMDLKNGTKLYEKYRSIIKAIPNSQNKHSRIILQAENNIIQNFHFLNLKTGQYSFFYDNLCNYKYDKSIKQDDAPDSLAGLSFLHQKYI